MPNSDELSPAIRRLVKGAKKKHNSSRSPYRPRAGYGWVDPYTPWESVQGNGSSDPGGTPSGDTGGDVGSGDGGAGL